MNKKLKIIDLAYIGVSVAILAVCAWISVPAGAIPITLQTMGVCVVAGLFGAKRGTIAVLSYLVLGAIGVPVFANLQGGIGYLSGATGGFVAGFLLSAIIIGIVCEKCENKPFFMALSMVAGLGLCYGFGCVWFALVHSNGATLGAIFTTCVLPFIVPDIIKIAISVLLVGKLKKFIK